jgi:hypothetical protein
LKSKKPQKIQANQKKNKTKQPKMKGGHPYLQTNKKSLKVKKNEQNKKKTKNLLQKKIIQYKTIIKKPFFK